MMIFDLTDCILRYNKYQDPGTLASYTDPIIITHLTKEKRVIVLATKFPQIISSYLSDRHFDFKIHKRIKIHADVDIEMELISILARL